MILLGLNSIDLYVMSVAGIVNRTDVILIRSKTSSYVALIAYN